MASGEIQTIRPRGLPSINGKPKGTLQRRRQVKRLFRKAPPTENNAAFQAISQAAKQAAVQETANRVNSTLGSSLTTALGGFGGFGRRKKATYASTTTPPAPQPSKATTTSDAPNVATRWRSPRIHHRHG